MQKVKIKKVSGLKGDIVAVADKSISQRAIMISALAKGKTYIDNFLDCEDSRRVIAAFKSMGIKINLFKKNKKTSVCVFGKGLYGLKAPSEELFIGNSGTTMRLISGILAAQNFKSILTGDASLSRRPMGRIIKPLRQMGAEISACWRNSSERPPLVINGRALQAIKYVMPIKSAQVKSCILLAGLFANGKTHVIEQLKTRDHTERMLKLFGAKISRRALHISLLGRTELLSPKKIFVPGDISSAAFFIVGALLVPDSKLIIRDVGFNPTRSGLFRLLKRMGANIQILNKKHRRQNFEPYVDIIVKSSALKAITVNEEEVAYCIDELPVLCVAACFAKGITKISAAGELRVKETDRIYSMVTNLKKMGAQIRSRRNDLIIRGTGCLTSAVVDSYGDHRTAMSMVVAGLLAQGQTIVKNTECIDKSFPDFLKILSNITELT